MVSGNNEPVSNCRLFLYRAGAGMWSRAISDGCQVHWIWYAVTGSGTERQAIARPATANNRIRDPDYIRKCKMAYVKHGTGPNDYKKGNRTKGANRRGNRSGSPDGYKDLTGLKAASAAKADRVAFYKDVAEQQAKVIKHGQEYAATLQDNLIEYIIDRQSHNKPLTIAGLIRASGVSADTYYRYRNGDADHMLYAYMSEHDIDYSEEGNEIITAEGQKVLLRRLSTIIKTAELAVQEQLEENCYTNRGNPAGSIFGLKARYEWRDDPDKVQQTNTLNIQVASLDEAREALKRLNE